MRGISRQNFWKVSANNFESTWNTSNTSAGSSTSTQVQLPLTSAGTYNFVVDWGDGNTNIITAWNQAQTLHTYASSGTYSIKISGVCTGWRFNNTGDKLKFMSVQKWGILRLGNSGAYFYGCSNLTLTAVSDVLNLTGTLSLVSAFGNCSSLTTVNRMNEWNTSAVTNMSGMFNYATNFNQNIGSWNTSSVSIMAGMFASTSAFNQNIGGWNTSSVTQMGSMFEFATAFNQNIGGWNTTLVVNMSSMFLGASAFNNGGSASINSWTTSLVTTMSRMFESSAFNQPIGSWNTSAVTTFNRMFRQNSVFNQAISSWVTTALTNTGMMFFQASAFNQNIGSWNVSLVTDMSSMFLSASAFNNGGSSVIGSWNTSLVTNMAQMFTSSAFNQNIGGWNVSSVTNMSQMFEGATVFNNGGSSTIGSWVTSSVTDMSIMFRNAYAFNQPIGSWNTSAVTTMSQMFENAYAFNQPIGSWNTSAVTSMARMFYSSILGNTAFNQPIGGWNVSAVTVMSYMFYNASAFDQNIGSWNVSNVVSFGSFMPTKTTSTFSSSNLDAIYNGWSALAVQTGISISFGTAKYTSAGQAGKNILTGTKLWSIIDGGANDMFESTWNTDNTSTGSSTSTQVQLPLTSAGTYNFVVDWGDGNTNIITAWNQAQTLHTYASSGTYSIKISGVCTGWRFNNTGDKLKFMSVQKWGILRLGNSEAYFYGCSNLTLTAVSDVLNLTGTLSLVSAFGNCSSLTTVNRMNEWNTSAVTDMDSMFFDSSGFNEDLSSWDVSSVTVMAYMFGGCHSFDQNLSSWNISNVSMFEGFMYDKTPSTFSPSNLDAIYNGWSALAVQTGISISFGDANYTPDGEAGKIILETTYGWIITDGTLTL